MAQSTSYFLYEALVSQWHRAHMAQSTSYFLYEALVSQ